MAPPIGSLLYTVFASILEVFLICWAGYILASRGILDKKTQKQLNRLNVSLFTPSLLFSKVAFFLSPAKLRELYVIPIFFIVVTLVSMTVAYTLGTIFRLKRSQRAFAMAAAMFMNSNSLPIALMQSLVVTVHGLKWGTDDNKNAMLGRALTYLVLYSTLGMVLRWSYGVKLLAQADDEVLYEENDERRPLLEDSRAAPEIVINDSTATLRPTANRRRSKFYNSFPNSPNASRLNLSSIASESELASSADTSQSLTPTQSPPDSDPESEYIPPAASRDLPIHSPRYHRPAPTTSPFKATVTRIWKKTVKVLRKFNDFMTVPLWAALASIIVACVQPLQHTLEVHLFPIKGALASAGNCSIPVTLVVLGAYFYTPKDDSPPPPEPIDTHLREQSTTSLIESVRSMFKKDADRRKPAVKRPGETKTVVIAVVSRMIITPMLLMPLMAYSAKFDIQAVFEDPVFVVANVLLISSPPALTLAQITQAASGDAFERLISRTIFWAYCVVTPPATIIYVMICLLLAK